MHLHSFTNMRAIKLRMIMMMIMMMMRRRKMVQNGLKMRIRAPLMVFSGDKMGKGKLICGAF